MRLDELYEELNDYDFIDNYYVSEKTFEDPVPATYSTLKILGDEFKIAEVFLDQPYMLRTTYRGFDSLNMIQKQALIQTLTQFAMTPVEQRRSEQYFAYYYDLNNITHYIKRLSNQRLTDEIIPLAMFRDMTDQEIQKYLFTSAEFEKFPKDYQPNFTPSSFVKVISYEDMANRLYDRPGASRPQRPSQSQENKENQEKQAEEVENSEKILSFEPNHDNDEPTDQ